MKLLACFICLLSFSSPVYAFKLEPMSSTIDLASGEVHANFTIENDTTLPLPIQIQLHQRAMNEEGSDILTPVTDLKAFPDQLIIPPEQKRSIRVMWSGDKTKLNSELSYRFIAEQLPVNLEKKNSTTGIKMLLKYVAALYVTPKSAETKIKCDFLQEALSCTNSGNKHQILNFKKIKLEGKNIGYSLSNEELKKISGENVLANSKRTFKLNYIKENRLLKNVTQVKYELE